MNDIVFLDIGNTSVDVLSPLRGHRKFSPRRLSSLARFLSSCRSRRAVLSSVVPSTTKRLLTLLSASGIEAWVLDSGRMRDFASREGYRIDNIDVLGADLFCDLVAEESEKGWIVLDCGTATKILALDGRKAFLGGALLPGLSSFSLGLTKKAALIPLAREVEQAPLISLDTDEAIAAGTFHGTAFVLEGYVSALRKRPGMERAGLVLTGGEAQKILPFLSDRCRRKVRLDLEWTLKGLRRCYQEETDFSAGRSSQKGTNQIE